MMKSKRKIFLVKFSIYLIIIVGIHLIAAVFANTGFDYYYGRFTNGLHSSMITGSSRAAQGIIPTKLQTQIDDKVSGVGNFAFTMANSPYGKIYLEAIKNKIKSNPDSLNIFIVTVSPWSLSSEVEIKSDGSNAPESSLFLSKMYNTDYSRSINFEYLVKIYSKGWGSLLFSHNQSSYLHSDGWLEINVPMDEQSVAIRSQAKFEAYRKNIETFERSDFRIKYFNKTIEFFKQHGKVFLIRLPVDQELLNVENILWPDFNKDMKNTSKEHNIPFINLMPYNRDFSYTDGNHLSAESASKLSTQLAKSINLLLD